MEQFIMAHELVTLIIVLGTVWAVERMVVAFINRNKMECPCNCCDHDLDDEEDDDEDELPKPGHGGDD